MTTAFKAVLFDLDGTLANTLPLCIAAFRSAIEPATGVALSDADIVGTFGPSEEGTIRALAPGHYDECVAAYLAHYERLHPDWPDLFAGMRNLLDDLRARGVRLSLVTGKAAASTQLSLRQFGLADYFELIETGSPDGPRKPEALRSILAAWQLAPAEAVYIGDAPSDVTAAHGVGMPVVGAGWADTTDGAALAAMAPDHFAASVDALRDWLLPRLAAPDSSAWLRIAQRVQALAQTGLGFNPAPYDAERYQELLQLGQRMLHHLTGVPLPVLEREAATHSGYATPKVDIRAVLFRGVDAVLMVREKADAGRWTLPGGWADVGYSPFEVAVKEVREETGLQVEAMRLLALWDTRKHGHPQQTWAIYKAFIACRVIGGSLLAETPETTEARWVTRAELPGLALSTGRVTLAQLERLFTYAHQPDLPAACD
ncbi:NUDIX hydrolase N-terminal domain-containing protein [Massilia sp. 9096]|uniref:NUDIX hydrolase N-terminal domain-containing protein n=1 Tax=Massilia sp. 9096 TaxID=1500894 RepID=UPI000566D076|nr:NUDIX hydrolase N-terminal domain-containing protein [Massilia sp. 9096]